MSNNAKTPIIIGGTGGSGTRVVQSILEEAGVFMGIKLNGSKDAMDFEPFLDETINQVLNYTHSLNYSPQDLPAAFAEEKITILREIAEQFYQEKPANTVAWGWKNPRSIYILPLIHAIFPNLYFIHVIRDGRDMALSANQNQLRKHYEAFFSHGIDKEPALASIELWSRINADMRIWGEAKLGVRYHYVRFEDLCDKPHETVQALLSYLHIENVKEDKLVRLIEKPDSLGRFQNAAPELKQQLNLCGQNTLKRFAYL